jgi:hypothetical protein
MPTRVRGNHYLWLHNPLLDLCRFFGFLTFLHNPWPGDQPAARPLPAHKTTQTQNKRTQTSMLQVGFEHTTLLFERAKTVHALDRAATVIGGARDNNQLREILDENLPLWCRKFIISHFWLITSNNDSIKPGSKTGTHRRPMPVQNYVQYLRNYGDEPAVMELSVGPPHCTLAGVRTHSHT